MKHYFLKLIMCFVFFTGTVFAQAQEHKINTKGIYKGYDSGYTFSIKTANAKGDVLTFQEIVPDLLYEFDLKSDTQIGKMFNIKYIKTIDDMDVDTEIHYTIVGLRLIK